MPQLQRGSPDGRKRPYNAGGKSQKSLFSNIG